LQLLMPLGGFAVYGLGLGVVAYLWKVHH
jgi:hypothetical protein